MTNHSPNVRRNSQLNIFHGTALVIGSMFGIGIFLYPPLVAKYTGTFAIFLLVWFIGGLISLCGALAYSELGVLYPKAGGDYTFHKELLGDATGFASGWLLFLGIFSGSIATMTSAIIYFQLSSLLGIDFSTVLLSYPWGGVLTASELTACGIILFFTCINMISIRFSGNLQVILTVIPVTLVLAFCLYGVFCYDTQAPKEALTKVDTNYFDIIKAYLLVYFAYAGWNAVVYFSGDFKNPKKDAFFFAPRNSTTTLFYFILGSAFVFILGFNGLQEVPEAGTAIAGIIGGKPAQSIMTGLIALAILASINGTVLAGGKLVMPWLKKVPWV